MNLDPRRLLTAGLLCASLAIALAFAIQVGTNWFLGDDCYITFRYSRHLARGLGLVWNPGERVEGYTSFSWVVLLATGMLARIPPEILANVVGTASGALLLVLLSLQHRRGSPVLWLLPLACLSLSRTFTAWCTGGLETMLFAFLVLAAVLTFLRERGRSPGTVLASSLLFALATLTRPEGGIFAGVTGLLFAADVLHSRRTFRSLVVWTLPYALIVGSHLLWRHSYYGFWLPNTFHAKVSGMWIEPALQYFGFFHADYRIGWFLPLALLSVAVRRNFATTYYFLLALTHAAYLLYVGGDRFEFRFLVVVLPYLYLLLADGILIVGSLGSRMAAKATARLAATAIAALLLVFTLQGSLHPVERNNVGVAAKISAIKKYGDRRAEEGKFLRQLVLDGLLPPDLVICVGGAGALPYYSQLITVDRRGLNDAFIAHLPLTERGFIAHEHDAPYEYLVRRGVVMFDYANGMVSDGPGRNPGKTIDHDGHPVQVWTVKARDRYLRFASFVPEQAVRRIFSRFEIMDRPGKAP